MNKELERKYNKMIAQLVERRSKIQEDELGFLLTLHDLPHTHAEAMETHEGSVERLLRFNKGIYDLTRYKKFVAGLNLTNLKTAKDIGHEMVIALSRIQDKSKLSAAIKAAKRFKKDKGSYPDSAQSYSIMVKTGARTKKEPTQEQQTISELLARIAALEAEVQDLKVKNRNLSIKAKGKSASVSVTS